MLKTATTVWRQEPGARRFIVAQAQGSLGTGAGYVALLVLAYERIGSGWAATAVMLADMLPAMLLGPLLGLLADKAGHRRCAVAAEAISAAAFAGLALAHGIVPMLALALLAGCGGALFRPAAFALLPGLVAPERLAALTGAHNAAREAGQVLGPAVAGGLLSVAAPAAVLGLDAATFAVSAPHTAPAWPRARCSPAAEVTSAVAMWRESRVWARAWSPLPSRPCWRRRS